MEGVNDAPDGAEEAYEWGYGARDCEPRHVALQPRDLFRAGNLHGALHGNTAALPPVLREAAFKHRNQRAGLELFGHGRDVLQALSFAKSAHEASALHPRPPN